MIAWLPNPQPNGMGWISQCGQFAIRECKYVNGSSIEYWCYYKPTPEHKFMHVYDGVVKSLDEAKSVIQKISEK